MFKKELACVWLMNDSTENMLEISLHYIKSKYKENTVGVNLKM